MSTTFVANTELTTMNCGECGGVYAIQEKYRQNRYRDGNGWNCPYCKCSWGYFGDCSKSAKEAKKAELAEMKAKRLEDERDRARRQAEYERNSKIAVKGHLTRQKKRAAAGTCACCKRSFANVAQHMEKQHPEFVKKQRPEPTP